jgi:hypothetical protein
MRPIDLNDQAQFQQAQRALPILKRALPYTRGAYTLEDIGKGILEGEMQLWCHKNSSAVTSLDVYPKALVCCIFLAAGFLDEVMEIREGIEEWAREQGCSSVMLIGRKGWSRKLRDSGYYESAVVLHKELEHVEAG